MATVLNKWPVALFTAGFSRQASLQKPSCLKGWEEKDYAGFLKGVLKMVKLAGVVMIIISCSAIGVSLSREMTRRKGSIKAHIEALRIIKSEILFKGSDLASIMTLLTNRCGGGAARFYALSYENASKGLTFSKAAEKNFNLLKKDGLINEDIEIIKSFCNVLGRYDACSQSEMISRAIEGLEANLSELKGEMASKGKLYRAIGATAGIVLALVII